MHSSVCQIRTRLARATAEQAVGRHVGMGVSGMLAEKMSFQLIAAVPWYSPDNGEDEGLRIFFRLGLPL